MAGRAVSFAWRKSFGGLSLQFIVKIVRRSVTSYHSISRWAHCSKDGLMTLNWLWLNDKQSVLSGRWGCCEEYIGPTVKTYAKMIQSLKKKKIKFVFTHGKRHIASIDCSNFTTNEFRQDPSGRWYDHKSNSSGLVSLGLIFFSCLVLIMF